jgi:flagella basal body P-ring formation protein FlgA
MHRFLKPFVLPILACVLVASGRAAETPATPVPFTREDFVAALAGNFTEHYKLEGELQLELLRSWSAPVRAARVWTVEVADYPAVMASAMLARCRILADGQIAGEYTITLHAALWRDAWSARLPLPVNATFDPALLEVRRVDFLRERDALPVGVGDHGFMFTRAVQPDRLLTWHDVSRRPLVRKGDLVEVAAIDGMLQVTMKGLAMENGAQGDTVTIRNPESRKDFSAQVIAENRVQIHF